MKFQWVSELRYNGDMKRLVILMILFAASGSGCGVRQFNAKKPAEVTQGKLAAAFGPFHAAGQGNGAMSPSDCGSVSGRPCARARVSVGTPFQFDSNTNDSVPHVTQAGAGKTKVTSGPRAPSHPRLENRDLHLIGRQTAPGEHRF